MNTIYQAITNAMADITPIAKDKKNVQQGFQYRGIDQVMTELNPILRKHKIFIYPEVINSERSERQTGKGGTLLYSILTIKYHFATEDGSELCTIVIGEGMDSGDKASNKAMAVAYKYACLQMFCIPTEDMDDPDKTTPPQSTPKSQAPKSNSQQKPPAPKPKPQDPLQHLKREAWELIKRLPQAQQDVWIKSCENAKESVLNEVILEVSSILYSEDRLREDEAPQGYGDELDIF